MNRRNYDSARKKVEAPSLLARGAAWVLTASLALLPACDWAAADGPWNHDLESAELLDPLAVGGALLTPDGSRPVAGALLQVEDALGAVPEQVSSDPDGVFAFVALPPERYTLLASSGQFAAARVLDLEGLREDQDLEPLRLSSTLPIVLDVRDAAAGDADPVDDRLRALGLSSVRVGPESAAEAADLFALPQGLFEYGLILIGGELDYEELDKQSVVRKWDVSNCRTPALWARPRTHTRCIPVTPA